MSAKHRTECAELEPAGEQFVISRTGGRIVAEAHSFQARTLAEGEKASLQKVPPAVGVYLYQYGFHLSLLVPATPGWVKDNDQGLEAGPLPSAAESNSCSSGNKWPLVWAI